MKSAFSIEVAGEYRDVSVERLAGDAYRVQVGEQMIELSAREVGSRRYRLIHEQQVRNVVVTGRTPQLTVHDRMGSSEVALFDDAQLARRALSAGQGDSDGLICAPMPGKVVKALVGVGMEVSAGQGVIVVEAMKMENELRAPRDGVVREFFVTQGEGVDAGQKLVAIE